VEGERKGRRTGRGRRERAARDDAKGRMEEVGEERSHCHRRES